MALRTTSQQTASAKGPCCLVNTRDWLDNDSHPSSCSSSSNNNNKKKNKSVQHVFRLRFAFVLVGISFLLLCSRDPPTCSFVIVNAFSPRVPARLDSSTGARRRQGHGHWGDGGRLQNPLSMAAIPQEKVQNTAKTPGNSPIWTREQLEEYANRQGVVLSLTTLGPGYRAIARAKHNTSQILGYIEGFVRPTGQILHVDKMEVFQKMVKRARSENPNEFKGGGTVLGVGLLIGYLVMWFGQEDPKCKVAEFLAIDDADHQHRRLVRYYKNAGFDIIRYVGDGFTDIPDRLVWGGCGTLLRKDISFLLQYWTSLMEKSLTTPAVPPNKEKQETN